MAYNNQHNDRGRNNGPQQNRPKRVKNPDPMSNVVSMGRYGMRLIKDMAFGKFNMNEVDKFQSPDFCMATIAELDKKITEVNIHITAITYTYGNSSDMNVSALLHKDRRTAEAYSIIRGVLINIIGTGGDTGFIAVLVNKLPGYKYNI